MTRGRGYRLVLDTNTVVRAFINVHSFSGQILKWRESRRVIPLFSPIVPAEYRAVFQRH